MAANETPNIRQQVQKMCQDLGFSFQCGALKDGGLYTGYVKIKGEQTFGKVKVDNKETAENLAISQAFIKLSAMQATAKPPVDLNMSQPDFCDRLRMVCSITDNSYIDTLCRGL